MPGQALQHRLQQRTRRLTRWRKARQKGATQFTERSPVLPFGGQKALHSWTPTVSFRWASLVAWRDWQLFATSELGFMMVCVCFSWMLFRCRSKDDEPYGHRWARVLLRRHGMAEQKAGKTSLPSAKPGRFFKEEKYFYIYLPYPLGSEYCVYMMYPYGPFSRGSRILFAHTLFTR